MSADVYVVDDDPAVRDSLMALLEQLGYRVHCFADAAGFLGALEGAQQGCALLDVRLPDRNGLSILDETRTRAPGLAVVMITGHGDVPLAVAAMKAGAVDFVEKPMRPECIPAVIEAAMAVKARLDPDVLARVATLTAREREVMEQLVHGASNKAIARALVISPRTAEVHRARVMRKMKARSLSHLVRMALAAGLDGTGP